MDKLTRDRIQKLQIKVDKNFEILQSLSKDSDEFQTISKENELMLEEICSLISKDTIFPTYQAIIKINH